MADAKTLNDLFIRELRRAYDGEQRLTKALLKLRDASTSSELKHAFQTHFEETEVHVDRLDQVFESLGEKAKAETCEGIKGIIKDGQQAIDLDAESAVKDAGLIAAAQEAEHFEIALYGTLRTWAVVLDHKTAMQVLEVTLEEEKNADTLLTGIANTLNLQAAQRR
jgi:ferritin-like metal-binding protein YciE